MQFPSSSQGNHPHSTTAFATADHDELGTCVFADIHLKVGDTVFLDFAGAGAHGRAISSVLGWREGASVMLTQPVAAGKPLQLFEGESLTLRVFTGQSAYAFRSNVRRAHQLPFLYVHISFPKRVHAVEIRRSPRSRVGLPATFSVDGVSAGIGTILDIGAAGALLDTGKVLDSDVTELRLMFLFELHGVDVSLDLHAKVLGMKGCSSESDHTSVQYRLAFDELLPNDRLILASLVWFQMYEHPNTIV